MNADDRAALVAMAGLPEMGPGRLRALAGAGSPATAWRALAEGHLDGRPGVPRALVESWRRASAGVDPAAALDAHRRSGIGVVVAGDAGYPPALVDDHSAPVVLFHLGDPMSSGQGDHVVSVVGTRRSTAYGEGVAKRLGAELAAAGVSVCSGLALGIDGAAHEGALSAAAAAPVAVVANGLDGVYPARHRRLWHEVAERGVIWSEVPMGTPPARWRFPSRNRLIAALGEVLVVVESPGSGGSFHTVREADDRGRSVMAVPGPVGSRASIGTNQLLVDGCPPCRGVDDVLGELGLQWDRGSIGGPSPAPPPPLHSVVLDAFAWGPATIDDLIVRTGLDPAEVARALAAMVASGLVEGRMGAYERVGRP